MTIYDLLKTMDNKISQLVVCGKDYKLTFTTYDEVKGFINFLSSFTAAFPKPYTWSFAVTSKGIECLYIYI